MDICKDKIDNFLKEFYSTISFKANSCFNHDKFKELFLSNAILIEKYKDEIIYKSVSEHIQEFNDAIKNQPSIFINGFIEKQESYEILDSSNYLIIKSQYSKQMTINGKLTTSYGYNIFTLTIIDKKIKIISVAW